MTRQRPAALAATAGVVPGRATAMHLSAELVTSCPPCPMWRVATNPTSTPYDRKCSGIEEEPVPSNPNENLCGTLEGSRQSFSGARRDNYGATPHPRNPQRLGNGQRNAIASMIVGAALALGSAAAHADCLDDAADYWGIPRTLSRAIAMHESGMRADAVGRNTNGSRDIGLMQINSSWLPRLARYGIKESDLFNACTNGYVGNWILADNIARLGFNWDAVGAYNAASPDKRAAYARKIYKSLMSIQATEPTRALR